MSFFLLDTGIAEDFAKRRNGVVERADEPAGKLPWTHCRLFLITLSSSYAQDSARVVLRAQRWTALGSRSGRDARAAPTPDAP
jgi:hypothetical protein